MTEWAQRRRQARKKASAKRTKTKRNASGKKLKSWSYSTWNMWKQCARRIYFSKIEKLPEPKGKALERGINIHQLAEDFIKGKIDEFPERGEGKELNDFHDDLVEIRDSETALSEHDFTFRDDWSTTHWRDWDGAWLRMKIDVFDKPSEHELTVIDFKTGRKRDYEKQLELYALGGFKAHPEVEVVTAEIWYFDHGQDDDPIESVEIHKDEEEKLQTDWERRAKALMNDTEFRPSPGHSCKWCPFSQTKDGPCDAG